MDLVTVPNQSIKSPFILVDILKFSKTWNTIFLKVSLLIKAIGPGDEGEYTCTALNPYGEAICTVYISPEATKQVKKSRSGHKLHKSKSGHDQQQLVQQQQQQQQVQQQQQFSQQSSMKQQSFQQSSVQQSSSIQRKNYIWLLSSAVVHCQSSVVMDLTLTAVTAKLFDILTSKFWQLSHKKSWANVTANLVDSFHRKLFESCPSHTVSCLSQAIWLTTGHLNCLTNVIPKLFDSRRRQTVFQLSHPNCLTAATAKLLESCHSQTVRVTHIRLLMQFD